MSLGEKIRSYLIHRLGGVDRVPPTEEEIATAFADFAGGNVDEWHFPMMNDDGRNRAYETALTAALKKGGTVLEIGTGSGLLAMIAARSGASKVITCEAISVIARKAVEIIKQNGLSDRIQVINKKSTDLVVGKDLSERADLLVAEIFDNGLIGEQAFSSYAHAQKELLKPNAQLIPSGARVVAMGLESREIFEMHRVSKAAGFDVSAFNEFARKKYKSYHLDRYDYRPLTGNITLFDFDFRQAQSDAAVPVEFKAQHAGICHAVAYWFELRLDEKTTIDTGPGPSTPRSERVATQAAPGVSPHSSWEQAVYCFETSVPLKVGDTLKLTAHHDSDRIWFSH